MSAEPSLMIVGERKKRGQPPIYGVTMTKTIEVCVTEEQFEDLKSVAGSENRKVSQVIRDAVDCYVGDFRERLVFTRPKPYTRE